MDNWTSFNLINALRLSSPELEKEMFANIPMLIRAGNSEVAKILLKDLLSCQETYDYSPEHYQCLSVDVQLQYKKMNILKKNSGLSYCSVIHCASINSSEEVLENLIKTFPNYNIGDSIGRKPIHYASAVPNYTTNM
jgi:ankyrin repeat protein